MMDRLHINFLNLSRALYSTLNDKEEPSITGLTLGGVISGYIIHHQTMPPALQSARYIPSILQEPQPLS